MFAIGDKEWPGISKLVEEAGEVLQTCGKLIATGGKIEHWDNVGTSLKERLENELSDLQAALIFVVRWCRLDEEKIAERVARKLERFQTWHGQGESNKGPRCQFIVVDTDRFMTTRGRCILMEGHEGDHKL